MYDLNRFIKAQENDYERALLEIKNGRKESHWIWYIFPQLKGLGKSNYSEYFGIDGAGEAIAYMADPILRARLIEITSALLSLSTNDPVSVLGHIDSKKVRSCMTLFSEVAPDEQVFKDVLSKFYHEKRDKYTLRILGL